MAPSDRLFGVPGIPPKQAPAGVAPRAINFQVETSAGLPRLGKFIETRANTRKAAERMAALRGAAGGDVDIAAGFHGDIRPATSKVLACYAWASD